MVDNEDLYFENYGESTICNKLTSQKPHERHLAMSLVMDFERLLINGDVESMEFQRIFRDCQMKLQNIESEE